MTPNPSVEELRKVAEEATFRAPWRHEQYHRVWDCEGTPVCKPYGKTFGEQDAIGSFISTFDPPTVLALLSELEAVKGERDDIRCEVLAELRAEPADEEIRALLSRAQIVAGHPADDEDQSNDAVVGREFIRLRHKIAASLTSLKEERDEALAALDANWVQHQRVVAAEARAQAAEQALSALKGEVVEKVGPFAAVARLFDDLPDQGIRVTRAGILREGDARLSDFRALSSLYERLKDPAP